MNNSEKTNNSVAAELICAVIPFYNEENTVGRTISEVLKYTDTVIAVNDGSTDDYLNRINKNDRTVLLTHKFNQGKGKALRTGFEESMRLNSQYTFTIDADMQHDPECIQKFLKKIENFDIVIGNRLHNIKDMPFHRRVSNILTSFFLSKKLKTKIIDSQCGYRLFRTNILKDILPELSGFESESEMIVKAVRNNCTIGFVNIPVIYGNDSSKMRSFQAVKGFLKVLFM